jgi:NADPH:quinone reductase-like Zn-dependent oxidoreductase
MPKIVRFHRIGGPENLKLEEAPSRGPGKCEVKLRVRAVGLNRAEAGYMRGLYLEQPELPSRIGYEAAGVVEAVGAGVDANWIGKRVATVPGYSMNRYGVLGEEAIVPADSLAEYPKRLSPIEAAAIWMQYLTAYGALVTFGDVHAGDFVVVTAASSGVGLAAIQIVKAEGATAIATTRTGKKREELLSLGADHVIATEEEDLVARVKELTGGKGARVIFDAISGPIVEKLAAAAAPGGIIFEYGFLSMQPTPFPLAIALPKGLSIRGYIVGEISRNAVRLQTAKQYIFDRLQDGRFQPKIAKTFSLEQASEAYEYLESNAQVGKIVIVI